jgi:hypothetical protein
MEKPRIVVVGSSNTDMIIKLRIPQPGETILGGEFATAAAAISVTRLGAQPSAPDRKEIEALLAKPHIPARADAPEEKLVKGGARAQTRSSGALRLPHEGVATNSKQNQLSE